MSTVENPNVGTQTSYPPPPAAKAGGRPFSIGAIICAAVALFFLPPVLGIAGIVLGVVGWRKGDNLGLYAAIGSGIALVAGMVIGAILFTHVAHTLPAH